VDPGQVQQILLNLSVNARDAMPHGGTLLLQTRNEHLRDAVVMGHSVAPPGAYVVLTVSDSGTGMDEPTMARMFEPFFTTKPKGQGTGLGLSTVFGIVEQSSGHIRARSAPGRGTTFDIFLPAVAENPVPVVTQAEPATESRGTETILLAEDDESLRGLLSRVLTSSGYHVLQAVDGADALRVADRHAGPLHLLASDVVMPVMGGHRLATELVARRPGVKVLFMSGYTEDAFAGDGLGPGDVFLQKPVDPAVLTQRVRALLDLTTS
jgi:CheY-like chemotaxis protein